MNTHAHHIHIEDNIYIKEMKGTIMDLFLTLAIPTRLESYFFPVDHISTLRG